MAQKILEYLNATSELELTWRDDGLRSVHLDIDLQAYVDADYAQRAEDRRSISSAAICCGDNLVSWLSRTQNCVTQSTMEAGIRGHGRRGQGGIAC